MAHERPEKIAKKPAASPRFIPLGAKLALGTLLVLLAVSGMLFVQLTGREQDSLIAAKSTATSMVAGVVANSLVAPLDFGDAEAATEEMRNLRTSRDLLYAGTWLAGQGEPFAEFRQAAGGVGALRPGSGEASTTVHPEYIDQVRPITKGEKVIGSVLLRFTLAPENAAYRESRLRFFWLSMLLAGGTSIVLLVLARRLIVSPLGALVIASRQLGEGAAVRVVVRANDEMGRLGGAFNAMAESIADREQRLGAATRELQQVLDNMGQAILVFGPGGHIEGAPSRQSAQLFGDLTEGRTVASLLFPDAPPADVEARAFDVWIEEAFRVPTDLFPALAELAPQEILLAPREGAPITLEIAFRHLDGEGERRRVMLVATDVTEKRRLEIVVRQLDEQHAQQMAAMRRLLAGGGQVFVAFVQDAEQRLDLCEAALDAPGEAISEGEIEQIFRHAHTLKGEARGFGLDRLLAEVGALEGLLAPLRARARDGVVSRREHAPALRAAVVRARAAIEEGREVFVAASPIGRAALDQIPVDRGDLLALAEGAGDLPPAALALIERLTARPFGEAALGLSESVPTWATHEHKRVRLDITGREVRIPPALQRVLPAIVTHLVRNSIAHGIETPLAREAAGKPPVGLISLHCEECPGGVAVTVEDDGAGLDQGALRARAGALGLGDEASLPEDLAFLAGVSSAPAVSELAGRGVGLAAVREEARSVGYEVALTSRPAQGMRFVVRPVIVTTPPETARA
jgi:HPt (histidine-containing phosphotransfer) domain-containing protein/PAS domain-containing protein